MSKRSRQTSKVYQMNDSSYSRVNRQLQLTSASRIIGKSSSVNLVKLAYGRFAWPFPAAGMRDITATQMFSRTEMQGEAGGFVT